MNTENNNLTALPAENIPVQQEKKEEEKKIIEMKRQEVQFPKNLPYPQFLNKYSNFEPHKILHKEITTKGTIERQHIESKYLENKRDIHFKEAITFKEEIRNKSYRLYTSNFVLDETYTLLLANVGYEKTIEFAKRIRGLRSK